jgi:maltose O-acetyltransferase
MKMALLGYVGKYAICVLPISSAFRAKRALLRVMGIQAEDGVKVNGHTWFYGGGAVTIGRDTWIGPGCQFYTSPSAPIRIGSSCDIAPEVSFVTGTHSIAGQNRRVSAGRALSITIGNGCWIGTRVCVLGGSSIDDGCVVGAGALVRTSLQRNTLCAGVPASVVRILD